MRSSIVLTALYFMLATGVQAATLNKCIDAKGQVTYSNLPCRNAKEARTVEIDPVPLPDPVQSQSVQAQPIQAPPSKSVTKPAGGSKESVTIQLETQTTGKSAARASPRQCDNLSDKLGRVFDKMDQARRKGYTQEQMDKWNQDVKDLERQKQQSGCF